MGINTNVSHNEVGIITMVNNETTNDTLHTLTNVIDGKTISLLAISVKEGWEFSHWEGSFYSEANPHTFLMDGHHEITAVFKLIQYTLSIDINGEGTVDEELLLGKVDNYNHGSQIKLTAVPNKGWEFDRWEGDLSGNVNPETIFIDSTKNIAAFFKLKKYPLAIKINGEGTVDEELLLGKVGDYIHGSQIKLTAVPNKGWEFDRWEGDLSGSVNPETIVLDSSKMVDAFFEKSPYTLEININGGGSITKIPNQDTFYFGDSVTLSALGDTGWKFDRWDGDVSGNVNPLKIFVDSTKSINAIFERIQYSLYVNINGEGSVTKNPNKDNFYYGDSVSLSATPDQGWNFDKWTGNISGNNNPYLIIIDDDKDITANFTGEKYSINISKIGDGSVITTPTKQTYDHNEEVTLTAFPDSGWIFSNWSGDINSTVNPINRKINNDLDITAEFNQLYSLNVIHDGSGTVYIGPKRDYYQKGDNVELTAKPQNGWEFDHWEGDLTGTNNPSSLTINSNKSVTAIFKEIFYDYKTENVIIVVMDGARYSESWGDPNHNNIPYMANYMSDQGVVNTNFYNMEETITTSGHIYMTTGVYQVKEGKSKEYPYYPSIFQYWREETTNTSNKAWVIASKDKLEPLGNCNLDSWKDKYLPSTDCGINGYGSGYRDDSITYTKAINVLSTL